MKNIFTKILNFIFSLLFPKRCVSCGKYGQFLCFDCAGEIEWVKTSLCPYCGKISKTGAICDKCKVRERSSLNSVIIASHYDFGPIKNLIFALKYDRISEVSDNLAEIILQRANDFSWSKYIITYVPISKSRQRTRGFNQSELMAKYISDKLDLPFVHLLARTGNHPPQVGLSAEMRKKNVDNAFAFVGATLERANVIIIDDVVTTNATLNECAKVLKANGAKKVIGMVVASNK